MFFVLDGGLSCGAKPWKIFRKGACGLAVVEPGIKGLLATHPAESA
jgi:hypothetical protein